MRQTLLATAAALTLLGAGAAYAQSTAPLPPAGDPAAPTAPATPGVTPEVMPPSTTVEGNAAIPGVGITEMSADELVGRDVIDPEGNSIGEVRAAGVIETYSVASCIEAADAAVKAASVEPVRMHLAFGIGGKSYVVLTGEVADVEAAIKAGCEVAGEKGMLVQRVVIPRPHKQVVEHLL